MAGGEQLRRFHTSPATHTQEMVRRILDEGKEITRNNNLMPIMYDVLMEISEAEISRAAALDNGHNCDKEGINILHGRC